MLEVLALGDCHCHSNAHTVVGSEGGTLGLDPLAVYPGFDRIGEEIVLDVVVLLGDHIHMALEYYGLAILISRCCGDLHYHIAGSIRKSLDTVALAPVEKEGADLLLVLGGAGLTCELVEIVPYVCGFEIFNT